MGDRKRHSYWRDHRGAHCAAVVSAAEAEIGPHIVQYSGWCRTLARRASKGNCVQSLACQLFAPRVGTWRWTNTYDKYYAVSITGGVP